MCLASPHLGLNTCVLACVACVQVLGVDAMGCRVRRCWGGEAEAAFAARMQQRDRNLDQLLRVSGCAGLCACVCVCVFMCVCVECVDVCMYRL